MRQTSYMFNIYMLTASSFWPYSEEDLDSLAYLPEMQDTIKTEHLYGLD